MRPSTSIRPQVGTSKLGIGAGDQYIQIHALESTAIMPFKSTFSAFKAQLKDLQQEGQKLFNEHSQSRPQQQYQPQPSPYPGQGYHQQQNSYPGPQPQPYYQGGLQHQQQVPPPVPEGTRPGKFVPAPPGPAVYWQPRFDPSTPVSAEWEHKLGNNNGWGNNEKQHYTDDRANSF